MMVTRSRLAGLGRGCAVAAYAYAAVAGPSGAATPRLARVPPEPAVQSVMVSTVRGRSEATPASVLPSAGPAVVISALFADGYADADADEAVQLWNRGGVPVDLSGWMVTDGEGTAGFPPGTMLEAGTYWWLGRSAAAFERSFGHLPDWVWADAASGARAMATTGGGPVMANGGDEIVLADRTGRRQDAVVFGDGDPTDGWIGPPVQPFRTSSITARNQVLYRKLDVESESPLADTDRAEDWASDPGDPQLGRRVRFPGWDLEAHLAPDALAGSGNLEIAVAPDALFGFLTRHLTTATRSVDLLAYTLDNPALAETLARLAGRGVRVRVLLDGSPAGGVDGNARWCAAAIASAGGQVFWMAAAGGVRPRYASAHAKLILIDDRTLVVATENPGLGAAPYDDMADGTLGRRGAALATDLPAAAAWARALIDLDLDVGHLDIRPYQERDPERGAPAPDFEPARSGGGSGYTPRAAIPFAADGPLVIEAITAPEQAPDPRLGLGAIVGRARPGDRLDVIQLKEALWWGRGSDVAPEISQRLIAYRAAARRGVQVRVLLDGYFDEPADENGNRAAANWLNRAAAQEGLALEARLGNPTGLGIHAKLVVLRSTSVGGSDWVHIGSLNGTEISSKANREVAFQIRSAAAAAYLGSVIDQDWQSGTYGRVLLPALASPYGLRFMR